MKIVLTMLLFTLGLRAADTVAVTRYRDQDLIPIKTKIRFTTLIVLPKGEEISEVSCGDTAYWVIDGKDNVLHVKPAREGAATNLNIVLKSKAIYSFLLEEIGSKGTPDLKVVIGEDEVLRLREDKAALERHGIEVEAARKAEVARLEAERHQIEADGKAAAGRVEKELPDRIAEFLSGSASVTLQPYGAATSQLAPEEQKRVASAYATAELADGSNVQSMETVGMLRGNSPAVDKAIAALEQDSLSLDPAMNTEIAVLNKINAAAIASLRSVRDTNRVLLSTLEQQVVDSKRKRDSEASEVNAAIARIELGPGAKAEHTATLTQSLQSFRWK